MPAKGVPGVFSVRDPRVDALSALYKPEKTTYARMDLLLLPDVEKSEGKAVWLDDVRNLDGIVVVARAFPDPSVFHPAGSVDARRDLDTFLSELVFADLFLMERRKDKLGPEMRAKSTPEKVRELAAVQKVDRRPGGGQDGARPWASPSRRRRCCSTTSSSPTRPSRAWST